VALDTLIQEKVYSKLPDLMGWASSLEEVRDWIGSLRRETERMGDSPKKVDRLINLATVDLEIARKRPQLTGNPTSVAVGPAGQALLARAEEVAAGIAEPSDGGFARVLGRPVFFVLAFGLLGMASAWVASASIGRRAAVPAGGPAVLRDPEIGR